MRLTNKPTFVWLVETPCGDFNNEVFLNKTDALAYKKIVKGARIYSKKMSLTKYNCFFIDAGKLNYEDHLGFFNFIVDIKTNAKR